MPAFSSESYYVDEEFKNAGRHVRHEGAQVAQLVKSEKADFEAAVCDEDVLKHGVCLAQLDTRELVIARIKKLWAVKLRERHGRMLPDDMFRELKDYHISKRDTRVRRKNFLRNLFLDRKKKRFIQQTACEPCLWKGNDRLRHPRNQMKADIVAQLPSDMGAKAQPMSVLKYAEYSRILVPRQNHNEVDATSTGIPSADAKPFKGLFEQPQKLGNGAFGTVFMAAHDALENLRYEALKISTWAPAATVAYWATEVACGLELDGAPHCMGLQGWRLETRKMRGKAMCRLHVAMNPMQANLESLVYNSTEGISGVNFLSLLLGAFRGVEAMHSRGIVHSDIKEDNFFVSLETLEEGEVAVHSQAEAAVNGCKAVVFIGDYGLSHKGLEDYGYGYRGRMGIDDNEMSNFARDMFALGVMIDKLMMSGNINMSIHSEDNLLNLVGCLENPIPSKRLSASRAVKFLAGLLDQEETIVAMVAQEIVAKVVSGIVAKLVADEQQVAEVMDELVAELVAEEQEVAEVMNELVGELKPEEQELAPTKVLGQPPSTTGHNCPVHEWEGAYERDGADEEEGGYADDDREGAYEEEGGYEWDGADEEEEGVHEWEGAYEEEGGYEWDGADDEEEEGAHEWEGAYAWDGAYEEEEEEEEEEWVELNEADWRQLEEERQLDGERLLEEARLLSEMNSLRRRIEEAGLKQLEEERLSDEERNLEEARKFPCRSPNAQLRDPGVAGNGFGFVSTEHNDVAWVLKEEATSTGTLSQENSSIASLDIVDEEGGAVAVSQWQLL
eukprot:gene11583-34283_t